ncbi:MAG: tRNA pseudouridine(38-40) synthase TruA, partial [Clostridia bacterium]|nr:tRNA pseudouridine(38-40) synthase TruA [Clostridia bacterium]
MRNLLLTISFDGSAYHGWQVQENAVTVQQTLQDAWETVCHSRDNVIGCSRTDAGVHANMYCCNFRTENDIPCEKLVAALNANLPDDIAVSDCREVPYEFHARYDCKSKEYIYRIWNKPEKNPFLYKYSLHYKYP